MCIPHRFIQGFFAFLLFSLLMFGAHPATADSHSLLEAQGQGTFAAFGQKAEEGKKAPCMFGRLKNRITQTWNDGDVNLIVPTYMWHNTLIYERERVRRYNENPWGGGLGLSIFDEDGDSHMLFLVAFLDSWNNIQPYGGYAFLKNRHFGANNDFRVGAGVSLGITAREEFSYIPFPLPFPFFGFGYKQLSLEAGYIPGGRNNGHVVFTWLRWTFD
jgi:palmitoyl transferase